MKNLDSLRTGAAASDGVIHCAFIPDFARLSEVCEVDGQAVEALGSALAGSDRPLIVTSGMDFIAPGRLATEEDVPVWNPTAFPRIATEEAARDVAEREVRISVVRVPVVHGDGDHGFLPIFINLARKRGLSAYVGDGANRVPAVHRLDIARLYRLALEKGAADARYHGAGEEGIAFREIAEAIGKGLNIPAVFKLPEEAAAHFGPLAAFAVSDSPAASKRTREELGWQQTQPGLIADLEQSASYFAV